MAVPKKRTSVRRKGTRRGGHTHKLSTLSPMACPNCGAETLKHHVCPSCGTYKGREIFKARSKDQVGEDEE